MEKQHASQGGTQQAGDHDQKTGSGLPEPVPWQTAMELGHLHCLLSRMFQAGPAVSQAAAGLSGMQEHYIILTQSSHGLRHPHTNLAQDLL